MIREKFAAHSFIQHQTLWAMGQGPGWGRGADNPARVLLCQGAFDYVPEKKMRMMHDGLFT